MKKLMCAVAALAAGVAMADVTSANIVGYQQISIPTGYSIFTPTFKQVDATKKNTLGDIIVLNADGEEFDGVYNKDKVLNRLHQCVGAVKLFKVYNEAEGLNMAGDVRDAMSYTTSGKPQKKWDANASVELINGEGVIINNTLGTNVIFSIAGEVEVDPIINIPTGYSVFGNFTPVEMTLNDIQVLNADFEEFDGVYNKDKALNRLHQCVGAVKLFKVYNEAEGLNMAGDVRDAMSYTTSGKPQKKWDANASVTLVSGESVIVNNTLGTNVFFRLKSPIQK